MPLPLKLVIRPDGRVLTRADLPAPNTRRWVISRKATIVAAVGGGLLSLDEARDLYMLTLEEYRTWERLIRKYGSGGLRVTRIQHYRA
jgi:hypothetical protein